jgi:hypothetical protein
LKDVFDTHQGYWQHTRAAFQHNLKRRASFGPYSPLATESERKPDKKRPNGNTFSAAPGGGEKHFSRFATRS